ncbi:alanine racemase [Microlunatus speluncae]|uniref:alanine racemase n=1 Tax=Microlunatus speluncae TaxID=2594267 RepID=UPI0012663A65|nr:alanine racemase [Microlunatus speluncae]
MTALSELAPPATAREARPADRSALLTVDLAAVAGNVRTIAASTDATLMAVLKADGFGHGAVAVAEAALANGATRLGVTGIGEALALRAAGVTAPVLSWLNPVSAPFREAIAADVELAVPGLPHLNAVIQAGRGAKVHLQLDVGMARDGAAPADWAELCAAARAAEKRRLIRVVGVMGHLGCADRPGDPCNAASRARFEWGVQTARDTRLRPTQLHLAATAATVTDRRSHYSMVRVGAGLVGIDPSRTVRLRPAMTLTAPVVSVRQVRAGTLVGYGHAWTTPTATQLALLPLGYADGLPRAASGRAEVLVRGRRRPVVGAISMDQTVVDLGPDPVDPGEPVTVFGPGDGGEPTVADWAEWAGTIEHEIVTGIGSRVPRRLR